METKEDLRSSEGSVYFGLKFRYFDSVYPILNVTIPVKLNDYVVVETTRGEELGIIALRKEIPHIKKVKQDFQVRRLIRNATPADMEHFRSLEQAELDAFKICVQTNLEFQWPIKFFKVEKLFDGSRYIIYYKKEDEQGKQQKKKFNMQAMVNELAAQLSARIELREVGNRGEAKIFGGIGSCGKTLCCVNWNKKGSSVTVKMAKEQGLAINIPKLTGCCGRLICCLSYERENYQDGTFIP